MAELWIERIIREAQEDGRLDVTEGAGKPIPGLSRPYDPSWWARNWVQAEQAKSAAADLAQHIERELPKILAGTVIGDMSAGLESLNALIAQHNKADGRNALPLLDVEQLVKERADRATN